MAERNTGHLLMTATMHLGHPAETVWPLLCPVREYDWIPHWECRMEHSESGVNELGCVFRTDFPGEGEEVWLTSRFEPTARLEFVRTGRDRVIHYVIELEKDGSGTGMTWTQHVTALTAEGRAQLRDRPKTFAAQMAALERMLGHYLDTGGMLGA